MNNPLYRWIVFAAYFFRVKFWCCTGWFTCRTTTRATAWWTPTSRWRGTCPATSTSSTWGPWLRWVWNITKKWFLQISDLVSFQTPDLVFLWFVWCFQPPKSSTGNGANPSDKVALVLHRQVIKLKHQCQIKQDSKRSPCMQFLVFGLIVRTKLLQGFTSCYRPLGMTCSTNGGKISVDELFPELFRWFNLVPRTFQVICSMF